jgi:8-amino-7-oxononanoate synthase
MTWARWVAEQHAAIDAAGRWRVVRDFDARGPSGTLAPDGRRVVSFASNDYLGLSADPRVAAAAAAALERWGTGATAARLIVGSRPVHTELEAELAAWKGTERALLFPTGYQANVGVLSALGTSGALICSDELNHASIIDGCRLARAEVAVYPHRDVDAVERLIRGHGRALVVTDRVFSMDGEIAPLAELAAVCARHGALLVVDEAHAVLDDGLDAPAGGGTPWFAAGAPVLRVGTLSKALGAHGGFVAGPADLIELLVNRARAFIFTTASAPAVAAAALAALRVVRSEDGEALRARLRGYVDRIAPGHPSPIVPVVLGSEQAALDAAARLLDQGLLVPAIRPPTVPPGTSRLRIALSAAHTDEQVDTLASAARSSRRGVGALSRLRAAATGTARCRRRPPASRAPRGSARRCRRAARPPSRRAGRPRHGTARCRGPAGSRSRGRPARPARAGTASRTCGSSGSR